MLINELCSVAVTTSLVAMMFFNFYIIRKDKKNKKIEMWHLLALLISISTYIGSIIFCFIIVGITDGEFPPVIAIIVALLVVQFYTFPSALTFYRIRKKYFSGSTLIKDIVPDATTAIKIAEIIWLSMYGEKTYDKQPFIAEYDSAAECWFVHGTSNENNLKDVPEIRIVKSNGKILYIKNGQ